MAGLLPLRGDADGRLVCSECMKLYKGDKARAWLFERYADETGVQVPTSAVEAFELRRVGGVVEWREHAHLPGRPPMQWLPFPGGTVSCTDCGPRIKNFRVFDPATGEEVGA